jgi:hypothetical protein
VEYKPDPSSPTTTVPEGGDAPAVERAPQDEYLVVHPGISDSKGNLGASRRQVFDSKTGALKAEAAPGESLDAARTRATSEGFGTLASGTQSDHVFLSDIVLDGSYAADLEAFIYERAGSCDPDSCTNGQPKTSGYVWFNALQTVHGSNASTDYYGMHAGLARGNGISANWFFDWSGYVTSSGNSLGPGKGHSIQLQKERWYRIRVWRLNQVFPGVYDWGAWVLDKQTGQEYYAGAWTLAANSISNAIYWMELGETLDSCKTDILGVHNNVPRYWFGPYPLSFNRATRNYSGPCDLSKPANRQTNTTSPSIEYTINDRQKQRTAPQGGQLWAYP